MVHLPGAESGHQLRRDRSGSRAALSHAEQPVDIIQPIKPKRCDGKRLTFVNADFHTVEKCFVVEAVGGLISEIVGVLYNYKEHHENQRNSVVPHHLLRKEELHNCSRDGHNEEKQHRSRLDSFALAAVLYEHERAEHHQHQRYHRIDIEQRSVAVLHIVVKVNYQLRERRCDKQQGFRANKRKRENRTSLRHLVPLCHRSNVHHIEDSFKVVEEQVRYMYDVVQPQRKRRRHRQRLHRKHMGKRRKERADKHSGVDTV